MDYGHTWSCSIAQKGPRRTGWGTVSADGTVNIWNTNSGRRIRVQGPRGRSHVGRMECERTGIGVSG